MIGCPDGHHIDIFAREQISVVFARKGCATKGGFGLVSDIPIDIADSDDIAEILGLVGDYRSLVAQADRTNTGPCIGARKCLGPLEAPAKMVSHQQTRSFEQMPTVDRATLGFTGVGLHDAPGAVLVGSRKY